MATIWQRNNKNSKQSLIEKNTEIIVFEPLRFILLLSGINSPKSNIGS